MKMDKIANSDNDEFYTPKYAILPILKYIKNKSKIWCPFDTNDSFFVKILKENGHNVVNTSLLNGDEYNFFNIDVTDYHYDYIISNPPYSIKGKVLRHLFELDIPFAMLVGVVGLFESKDRFNMFKTNSFEIMYFDKRISYFKSYIDEKPSLNPPFSSVYICHNFLPKQIVFEEINKNRTYIL